MSDSNLKRTVTGIVLSNNASKTISVQVERRVKHKIGKFIKKHSKLQAHDEQEIAKVGDTVLLQECRPISKTKSWRLVSVAGNGE